MKRQIFEHNAKLDWSHFIDDRSFLLNVEGERQTYAFKLDETQTVKLETALAEYRKQYPRELMA